MNPYLSILLLFAFAATVAGGFLIAAHFLRARAGQPASKTPYECGLEPVGSTRQPLSVKFYLPAMLFILFDVEVVFLYPWAVLFKEFKAAGQGAFLLGEMLIFLGVLTAGLLYIYGRRALEWD